MLLLATISRNPDLYWLKEQQKNCLILCGRNVRRRTATGHWFRSSGISSRTQVLPISLVCCPREDISLRQSATWHSVLCGRSQCSTQTWWGLAEEERLPFSEAFLGAKTARKASKPISFLSGLASIWITGSFLNQSLAQGGIISGPISPTSELG